MPLWPSCRDRAALQDPFPTAAVGGGPLQISRSMRGIKSRPKGAWFTVRTEHIQFLLCERAMSKPSQKVLESAAYSNCVQRISYFLEKLPFPLNTSAT